MTGEYLRLSPFVFIHREVAALRRQGFHVETFSIRGLADSSEAVNDAQREEAATTFVVLPPSIGRLLGSHVRAARARAGSLAARPAARLEHAPAGPAALFRQLAYFAEAGVVAERMRERGLVHLHNHFASSSGTVAMLAAELGGFTFSISEHGPDIFYAPEWWRLDAKFSRALFVACISHFCRSQVLIWTPVDRWHRVHIVHCGVDPAEFTPAYPSRPRPASPLHRAARRREGRCRSCSRRSPVSATEHPDVELALAGDGPDRAQLEAEARRLGIADRVRFLGYQSSDHVRSLLQETDVFVLPSFAEGVPVVLMEAMASGVPVVSTRVAGVAELVEDGVVGLRRAPGRRRRAGRRHRRVAAPTPSLRPALRRRRPPHRRARVRRGDAKPRGSATCCRRRSTASCCRCARPPSSDAADAHAPRTCPMP